VTLRSLADLSQGARGRIVELRLPPGRRALPTSPLRPGATIYVAEATGGRWLHVRIDHREYSIPLGVAERVVIEVPERRPAPPRPRDAYAVLLSRLDRRSWRVRVIDRASGVVVRSEWFEEEPAARRRLEQLAADADTLDGAAFRARYRLP
jgi:hypothetical protein